MIADPTSLTDPELLYAAVVASKRSVGQLAIDVLGVDLGTATSWLAGDRPMPAAARALCIAITARPVITQESLDDRGFRLRRPDN